MKTKTILLLGIFLNILLFHLQASNPLQTGENRGVDIDPATQQGAKEEKKTPKSTGSNQKKQPFTISKSSVNFSSSGGKEEVLASDNDWGLPNGKFDWYEVNKSGNSIVIEAKPNNSTTKRKATFWVKDKEINIYQNGATPVLNLSTNRLNFRAVGEDQPISVTTNVESWDIRENNNLQTWCHVRKQGNNIVVTCEPNKGASPRNGTIQIITGEGNINKTIQINQAGTSLSVSPSSLLFSSAGDRQAVEVRTSGSNWKVESISENWCKIESLSTQGFTVVCSENPNTTLRNAEIRITIGNITEIIII